VGVPLYLLWRTRGGEQVKLINFYEVMDRKGDIAWGGASVTDAVEWFRRGLDNSIFVSVWDETTEDPVLVTDKIEVTNLLLSLLVSEREEYYPKPKKEWAR